MGMNFTNTILSKRNRTLTELEVNVTRTGILFYVVHSMIPFLHSSKTNLWGWELGWWFIKPAGKACDWEKAQGGTLGSLIWFHFLCGWQDCNLKQHEVRVDFPEKETNEQRLKNTLKICQVTTSWDPQCYSPCLEYWGALWACSYSYLPSSLGSLCSGQEIEILLKGRHRHHSSIPNLTLLLKVKTKALLMDALKEGTPQAHQEPICLLSPTLFPRLPHSSLPISDCSKVTSSVRPSWPLYLKLQLPPTLFLTSSPHPTNSNPCFLFFP